MLIAIAGGTGIAGAAVARVAQQRGYQTRVLSRGNGVDVRTGAGLTDALSGVSVVIDTLSTPSQKAEEATAFFTETSARLLDAGRDSGVAHHIALSIVGVDKAPHGYYAGKLAQEQRVESGDVPWTIQRTTQFHDFAAQMYANASVGPLHLAVNMRTQPIAIAEVAARLVDLAEADPQGHARDLAGPREEQLADMMRAWARHHGHRGWMPSLSLPGSFGRAMRDGSILPGADAELGTITFAEWLKDQQ